MVKRGNLADVPGVGFLSSLYEHVFHPGIDWLGERTKVIRQYLKENQATSLVVTLAVIVIAGGAIVYQVMPSNAAASAATRQGWFYDLNTNKLFTARMNQLPPIVTESGDYNGEPAGVTAYVMEDASGERHIGWLEKYSAEARKAMEEQTAAAAANKPIEPEVIGAFENGRLIKRVDDTQWYPEMSEEAVKIRQEAMQQAHDLGWKYAKP